MHNAMGIGVCPEFYYVTNTFGACRKMSEYNYTLDEN